MAVGWVRGGEILEIAAQDPAQGVVFYALEQKETRSPELKRNNDCLACHLSWDTLGVPGLMVESVNPLPDEISYVNGYNTVHASPLNERWGGWWVTGNHGGVRHMGNIPVMPADKGKSKLANPRQVLNSVEGQFDLAGYPTPYSDVVAQMVLAHQVRMTNLITRTGWEARLAAAQPSADANLRVREAASDLVDYLLFVDEAPFVGPMQGSSGFAEWFAKQGPRDAQGRSLREFDLRRRLFKYPCSYMIYTPAFDALPSAAKDAVYARMWEVLSGREKRAPYSHASLRRRASVDRSDSARHEERSPGLLPGAVLDRMSRRRFLFALLVFALPATVWTDAGSVPAWLTQLRPDAERLLAAATADDFAWRRLAELTDTLRPSSERIRQPAARDASGPSQR